MGIRVAIIAGPLPLEACSPACVIAAGRGAVSSFLGVVRDHARGRAVRGLFYECYRPMAEHMLGRLALEAVGRFDQDLEVMVCHGTGAMVPGQISVAIHAASAHREAACAAARHIIERIKQDLPVWKRQTLADGDVEWVKGS